MTSDQQPIDPTPNLNKRLDVDFALQAAGLGVWEFDAASDRVYWDDRCRALFGITGNNQMTRKELINLIHPDDTARVNQAIAWAMDTRSDGSYDQTYRVVGSDDDQLRWVRFQGRVDFSDAGAVHRFAGVAQDVTQPSIIRQQLEEVQQQLLSQFEQAPVGISTISGHELTFRSANPFYGQIVGRSPQELVGKPLSEVIPEVEGLGFDTLLRGVMASGQSYTAQEVPAQLIREGHLETAYFTFTYQPHWLVEGVPTGVLMIATEVTDQVQARQKLEESEARFKNLVMATPAATAVYTGRDMIIQQVNTPMLAIWGKDPSVIGKPLLAALPELEGQPFLAQLQHVFDTGEPFRQSESAAELVENGQQKTVWFNHRYNPLYDKDGQIYGVINTASDVTAQVLARQQVEQAQRQILDLFEQSPVGIALINTDKLTFRMANPFYGYLAGRAPDQLVGKPLLEALPELAEQGFDQLLNEVILTGKPFIANEVKVDILRNGELETIYVDLACQPQREADKRISGVLVVATDVTQQVYSRQRIEVSEARLRGLIAAAPAGIGLFVGRDLIIDMPNQTFIDIVGKGPLIEGLPLREAMPELLTEGQPFLNILDEVYTTGVPFLSPASLVKIVQNGVLNDNYYNISYVPIRDESGQVYAILDIAIDVTTQVQTQLALEQKTIALQNASELAELGTFSVDLATDRLTVSPRTAAWFGFEELTADTEAFVNGVGESEREYVRTSLYNALQPASDGRYDVVHSVIHAKTGDQTIIHALGRVSFNAAGQPVRIEGTAQDITAQRALQRVLEQQVKQRTEELAAINEELTSSNEEYAVINEELEESNSLLSRSNDNLQTFAYVASHDLQEPLRKIQQFGDLLKTRLAESIGKEELVYLDRMQLAASRMSSLIRDLLDFSRITTRRSQEQSVALSTVVDEVIAVLEVVISETDAKVQIGTLPTVLGDATQLAQLFQNLLSNALKFRKLDTPPQIRVSNQTLAADELPTSIKPTRKAAHYHQIEVTDNGIGFEEKYLDRIFQVFQRLHGKSQYAGTGVGLAICEKVVTNHGGVLTASSQPGQGATFSIYLPATS